MCGTVGRLGDAKELREGAVDNVGSAFETNEPLLSVLLDQIGSGYIQLPDFQRGWIWDDERIRGLIASVSLSHPIGAVMLLEAPGGAFRFKPRLVEGVSVNPQPDPQKLILDGQQRLTSLWLSLVHPGPVPTKTEKDEPVERFYYLDIEACLDPERDRLDAVISVPKDRIIRTDFAREIQVDLRTREGEYQNGLFPLPLVFNPAAFYSWIQGYQEHFGYDKTRIQVVNRFAAEVWQRFQQYKVPVIELLKDTSKEAVCRVFEKVNTGGVVLSVFELLTATFAADDFSLRDNWEKRQERFTADKALKDARDLIQSVDQTSFLTAVTLASSYRASRERKAAVGCKRKDVLRLDIAAYREHENRVEKGLIAAAKFLVLEKVFSPKELPYSTQLVPLAVLCAELGSKLTEEPVRDKLRRWYWCGVFGELYGGGTETRFALDVPQFLSWLDGGDEPQTIRDCSFAPTRLLTLQTRNSAAYQGLMVLLMQLGSRDFLSGQPIDFTVYFEEAVDVHHIFPKAWSQKAGISKQLWNCVLNKTPMTARTNRRLGGYPPSRYIASLEAKSLSPSRVNEILRTHALEPEYLRRDDFMGFIRDRAAKMLDLIERATGKPIAGRDSVETISAFGGALLPQR